MLHRQDCGSRHTVKDGLSIESISADNTDFDGVEYAQAQGVLTSSYTCSNRIYIQCYWTILWKYFDVLEHVTICANHVIVAGDFNHNCQPDVNECRSIGHIEELTRLSQIVSVPTRVIMTTSSLMVI